MSQKSKIESRMLPLFQGIRPLAKATLSRDIIAGVTLAALAIPEVMGYTSIAGMPVVTGLYTILLPTAVFAILGSSRHLVVGADSATAAILAAGIGSLATAQSSQYVALAGMAALMCGGYLVLARLAKLGFIADFLSRTVLIGFLTGVGIQVAIGQVPDILGLTKEGSGPLRQLWNVILDLPDVSLPTLAVSAAVVIVILGGRAISPKLPGPLIAVVGSIIASAVFDFADGGIATLGDVPGGLPSLVFPSVATSSLATLAGVSFSMFVVILAQSAATSRAYAARYSENFEENVDLVGLGLANVAAGFTGTFVVNGSPTKTQMVDSAGGRSQISTLTMAGVVLVVLLFLTGPLSYMPNAVLAAVVFLIGIELVDLLGMKNIFSLRRDEFVVALITAAMVVFVGVLQGILLAIVLSVIIHLRLSYKPHNTLVVQTDSGRRRTASIESAQELIPGLIVYHFAHSVYYANANQFNEELLDLADAGDPPVRWICIVGSAIADVDYSASETLREVYGVLLERNVRLVLLDIAEDVRAELDRYRITELIGDDMIFDDVESVIEAFNIADGKGKV
jgi:sulfate permease, SulP family